jgi:hypothetical protein
MGGALSARKNIKFCLRLVKSLKMFRTMYVLAFGAKIKTKLLGGAPHWPSQKNVVSQEKKSTNIFAPDPQFVLKILKY